MMTEHAQYNSVQKTDVLRDITQCPSTSGTRTQMNISDLKDSSDEGDVTSGSEYFPAIDDEDPEESVSRQQIAYKRNIVKVKRKVFPEKTHNLQKDIQKNTSIAKTNEEEIETSGTERKNVAKVSKKRKRNPEEQRSGICIANWKGYGKKSNKDRSALQGELSQINSTLKVDRQFLESFMHQM
ncbi:hypothetical protein JTB14_025581 [Gonioctena quinquepunctata]|nr:hypothetical protein JTB14_025581 [Gonioctena quinquepunctata]